MLSAVGDHDVGLAQRLRDACGNEYDDQILNSATEQTDTELHEKDDDISWQVLQKGLAKQYEQQQKWPSQKPPRQRHNFEISL